MGEVIYLWLKSRMGPSPGSQPDSVQGNSISPEKEKGDTISECHTSKLSHYVDFTAGENQIAAVNIVTF